jgi:hypothetical protein
MPILPKGNPKRLIGRDFSTDSSPLDQHPLESIIDFSFRGSVAGTYLLRQARVPTLVFSWEVEGIDIELPDRPSHNR